MSSRTSIDAERRVQLKEWPTRRIALLALPDVSLMSLGGPLDVFLRASAFLSRTAKRRSPAYEIELLTLHQSPLSTGPGLAVAGGVRWTEAHYPIDTLLILANANITHSRIDPELVAWVRARAKDVRRIGSVCAGAFVLAAAGILDGRQATTHWELADVLAQRYPRIFVDGDRIFTQDGSIWTSAGVSSGVDLALAMVEEDHGHGLALEIARRMVLFMRRGAGQSQFSSQLAAQAADHQPIRELIAWISEHLDADLSVPALARRVGMSDRNFSRVFTQQVSTTPARFVARLRTEAARAKLAAAPEKLEAVAQSAGFGDGETLRRHLRSEPERLTMSYPNITT
ncbi:MAG: DJ-1/PfpI family protein [Candidatus Korobacteraceae bacterium]